MGKGERRMTRQLRASAEPTTIAAWIGAALVLLLCASAGTTQDNSDFLQFYTGARLLGPNLYSVSKAVDLQRSLTPLPQSVEHPNWWAARPPFEYVAFVPLSRISYQTARRIWLAVILAALAGFVWLWPGSRSDTFLCLAFCFPVLQSLRVAQDCLGLMFVLALIAALHKGGRPLLAGLAASLCMAKPSTLVLVPLSAMAFRSTRYCVGLGAGLAGVYLVSAAIMRDPLWALSYVRYTLAVSPHTSTLPLWTIPIFAAGVTVWCVGRPPAVVLAALACAGMALSPRALYYDLAWAVPLGLLLIAQQRNSAILVYSYPSIAGFAWYFLGWDGGRLVTAAFLGLSMAVLGSAGQRQTASATVESARGAAVGHPSDA
jgi:hypothetical protein